ncbi:type 4 fimbrial biogenesis protein PilQ [Hahella chejuensis KCTC 2396]|uniref:Type 4 fimbrial biogenesis protein PilQ n=2 Tax=Hahella chejuensis TaxID=158327 RepID=Q2S9Q4_HAHCH|nr:type 4 fimbrial biogenesis protein PilQ [Hahella chejuensis KCTC 2396]
MTARIFRVWLSLLALGISGLTGAASLTGIEFAALPGDRTEVKLHFDSVPPEPKGYTIEQPARIALDFEGITNGLSERNHQLSKGNTQSVTVLEATGRTRIIVNLLELVPYTTGINGNTLVLQLGVNSGPGVTSSSSQDSSASTLTSTSSSATAQVNNSYSGKPSISEIDFLRGEKGDGRILITLTNSKVSVDMSEEAGNIRLQFAGVTLPANLQRRLDVTDFATPVRIVDSYMEGGDTVLVVKPTGDYDYLAYQADNQFTLAVEPLTEDESEQRRKEKFPYTGEKLSLNFQDIEVRSVLQLIADFTGLNLVASDTVGGRITLRLQNVPWDQALELILKTKGLDQRKVGNVLLVAPAEEIAAREKLELEASKQVKELAPVRLEVVQINYAKAKDIVNLLKEDKDLISTRGFISSDERTNTISIRETADKIGQVRRLIQTWDIPVSQVLIEARIVRARSDAVEELGVQWGGTRVAGNDDSGQILIGGGMESNIEASNEIARFNTELLNNRNSGDTTIPDGPTLATFPSALAVDLGVTRANTSGLAIGFSKGSTLLQMELSAFESDGKGEIVAQPKIVTADRQTARIESGEEIPYQEASSSGATSVSFKKAVLSLEVTPQITPDDKIIMDLVINQDSRGVVTANIPSIDTNEIETQVLVGNGETIVLGGIFTSEQSSTVTKTPFLGDIPYLGRLFRKTENVNERSELLVFITPKLITNGLIEN